MYDMYPTEWGAVAGDDAGPSHPGTDAGGTGEPTERNDDN